MNRRFLRNAAVALAVPALIGVAASATTLASAEQVSSTSSTSTTTVAKTTAPAPVDNGKAAPQYIEW